MKYRKLHKWKYELLLSTSVAFWTEIEVDTPYISIGHGRLTAKSRYAWDGASFIAIDTKTIMRASLFHDCLYNLIQDGHLPKSFRLRADKLFRSICLQDGMSKFRAWYCYNAVRIGGGFSINRKSYPKEEIIEI